jgi:spermidine/putrescine transport system substrate-binding protein
MCVWMALFIGVLYIPDIRLSKYPEQSISILAWPDVFDASYVAEFEEATGIKVYVNFFEFNEELLIKLRTSTSHGYDLVMPSDYTADILIQEGLVKQIDKTRLHFMGDFYPTLLGHYFDPNNEYTVPYFWGVYGLGTIKEIAAHITSPSWGLIFDKAQIPGMVCMVNDAREAMFIAAQYLFHRTDNLTTQEYWQIKKLLLAQKQWVMMYSDLQVEYLLGARICPLVVTTSGDVAKVMRWRDDIAFLLPQEGTFVILDSFALAAASNKDDLVYQFLNYLYQKKVFSQYVKKFGFFSPLQSVKTEGFDDTIAVPTKTLFKKFHFFSNKIPSNILHECWLLLKS